MRSRFGRMFLVFLSIQLGFACFAIQLRADDDDPPTRVARLAYAQGSISFQPAGTSDWVAAGLNRPMTTGDKIWSDTDGRVELQLDGSLLRLSQNTGCSFLNLGDNVTQVQLTAGTLLVRVQRLDENETYEIDTPNLAFSVVRPGLYKIAVNENGDSTEVVTRSGEGEVTGGGVAYTIHTQDAYVFSGVDQLYATRANGEEQDQFEAWAASRDRRWENSRSGHYVPEDVIGYQDLDEYGSWRQTPNYGDVWFPRVSESGWAPYHNGHWDYIEPWGYTWVDDEPWGFAPFHYGRWMNYDGAWGWVPAPVRTGGAVYTRPVYAPALVAWVGGVAGADIAWFALGPREVYVPAYPASSAYVDRVNVSNTTVSSTVVNNYYNTTIVNKSTTVSNVSYVNRSVPGAVVATSSQAFTTAQPVARNAVKVDPQVVATAHVRPITPTIAPVKQSVLGAVPAKVQPPSKVQTRVVVAKATPPPPPASFEKSQEAIKSNGGKPLSNAQIKHMASAGAPKQTPVKIAPTARPVGTPPPEPAGRAAQPNTAPGKNRPTTVPSSHPTDRPPSASPPNAHSNQPPSHNVQPKPAERPTERPTERPPERKESPNSPPPAPKDRPPTATPHPNDQAPASRTTPHTSNANLDKKQQQEQEQLHARQEQERQRSQQQQEQKRSKAPAQPADQSPKQRNEQKQQTQQQRQKQTQVPNQSERKQQEERKNQDKPQKPAPPPQL